MHSVGGGSFNRAKLKRSDNALEEKYYVGGGSFNPSNHLKVFARTIIWNKLIMGT